MLGVITRTTLLKENWVFYCEEAPGIKLKEDFVPDPKVTKELLPVLLQIWIFVLFGRLNAIGKGRTQGFTTEFDREQCDRIRGLELTPNPDTGSLFLIGKLADEKG